MQSGGAVTAPAIYMEEMFLADTLKWIGVEPSFIQIGDYKGAEEMYANSEPSDAWNENIDQLLDSLYATARETMERGRSLNERELDEALASALFLDGEQAIELGLMAVAVGAAAMVWPPAVAAGVAATAVTAVVSGARRAGWLLHGALALNH